MSADDLFSFACQNSPESRILFLRAEIARHNRLYYNEAEQEITDSEYDKLYRELELLESQHPGFADPNSPTRRVGGEPLDGFRQIRHAVPMLSIDDVFELKDAPVPEAELISFYQRLCKNLGSESVAVTIEPKIDGVAVSILYREGKLEYAATRGDGTIGDDVTQNVRTIRSIPLELQARDVSTPSVDLERILPYAAFRERSHTGPIVGSASPQDTAGSLREKLAHDLGASYGTNVPQRLRQEAQSVVSWARENGRLLDGARFGELAARYPSLGGQSEHAVFYLEDAGRVMKLTIAPSFGAQSGVLDYLSNMDAANRLFGDDIRLHGVLETANGPSLVTSQPYVPGTAPSPDDISVWFQAKGFRSSGHNRWENTETGNEIADAHAGNLIKSDSGELIPIDLQILNAGIVPNDPDRHAAIPSLLEVRGEIFMPNDAFAAMNAERDEAGLPTFANPRNSAAGTLKQLDPREVAKRPLAFLAHGLGAYEGPELASEDEFHELLDELGIPRNKPIFHADNLAELLAKVEEINQLRHSFRYGTDGAVVKLLDRKLRESLGTTSRAPRWAAAYKFLPEQKETLLKDITIQVGRTGVLTPVAELEPVLISGTTVSRATLHNEEEIQRKDLRIGDRVLVEKAGEIIPAIVKYVTPPDEHHSLPAFSLPAHVDHKCPSCGGPIAKEDNFVAWRCQNFECPAQAVTRIKHFASRKALDIKGVGETVAEALVNRGLCRSPLDLFSLAESNLANLNLGTEEAPRRFGGKNASKVIAALSAAKSKPLSHWIFAMGIRQVGESAAKELSRLHASLAELVSSPILTELARDTRVDAKKKNETLSLYAISSEVGPAVAESVLSFFRSAAGQLVLSRLDGYGISPPSPGYHPLAADDRANELPLSGKTFVITGTLGRDRDEMKALIEAHGGKVSGSVSSKTHYVIAGEGGGSKAGKAAQLNIPVISEETFLAMLPTSP